MVYMAIPYTLVLTLTGLAATYFGLYGMTETLYDLHLIEHHSASEMLDNGSNKGH
jgi:NhaB family Na+:H+ antiporter